MQIFVTLKYFTFIATDEVHLESVKDTEETTALRQGKITKNLIPGCYIKIVAVCFKMRIKYLFHPYTPRIKSEIGIPIGFLQRMRN